MALKLKYFSPRDHRYAKIYQEAREYISLHTKSRLISLAPKFSTYTRNTTQEWEEYLTTLACKYEIFGLYANAYHDLEDLRKTGRMSRLLMYSNRMQRTNDILGMLGILGTIDEEDGLEGIKRKLRKYEHKHKNRHIGENNYEQHEF